MPDSTAKDVPPEPRAHHLNTCVQCRDWGKYERHEDHSPRVFPSAETAEGSGDE